MGFSRLRILIHTVLVSPLSHRLPSSAAFSSHRFLQEESSVEEPSAEVINTRLTNCVQNPQGESEAWTHENGSWIAWAYVKGLTTGSNAAVFNNCRDVHRYSHEEAKKSLTYFEAMDGDLDKAKSHWDVIKGVQWVNRQQDRGTLQPFVDLQIPVKIHSLQIYAFVEDKIKEEEEQKAKAAERLAARKKRNQTMAAIFASIGVLVLIGALAFLFCRSKRDPMKDYVQDPKTGGWVKAAAVGKGYQSE